MTAVPTTPPLTQADRGQFPPLEIGYRLTRVEFERRYAAMPWVKKAELIEGLVYTPSPVRVKRHSKPHVILSSWLGYYPSKTPGLEDYGDNGTVRLDEDNEPQPDLFLLLPKRLGGVASIDEDDYVAGAPTWVAEIAATGSESIWSGARRMRRSIGSCCGKGGTTRWRGTRRACSRASSSPAFGWM